MNIKEAIRQNQKLYGISNMVVRLQSTSISNTETKFNKNNKSNKSNKMNKSTVFMAVAQNQAPVEQKEFKNYIGIANTKVVAINPNKAELEKLMGKTIEKDPVYFGESEINGEKVKTLFITFYLQPNPKKYLREDGTPFKPVAKTFFINNTPYYNRDKSKVLIIDKYGRTAWATVEDAQNHIIPMYTNGPAHIDKDYRMCYRGEEKLFEMGAKQTLLRAWSNIQNFEYFNSNTQKYEESTTPDMCIAYFDDMKKLFNGDFTELRQLVKQFSQFEFKAIYGLKETNGRKYFDVCDYALKLNGRSTNAIEKWITERTEAGGFANTTFEFTDIASAIGSTDSPFVASLICQPSFASSRPFTFAPSNCALYAFTSATVKYLRSLSKYADPVDDSSVLGALTSRIIP